MWQLDMQGERVRIKQYDSAGNVTMAIGADLVHAILADPPPAAFIEEALALQRERVRASAEEQSAQPENKPSALTGEEPAYVVLAESTQALVTQDAKKYPAIRFCAVYTVGPDGHQVVAAALPKDHRAAFLGGAADAFAQACDLARIKESGGDPDNGTFYDDIEDMGGKTP